MNFGTGSSLRHAGSAFMLFVQDEGDEPELGFKAAAVSRR